MDVPQFSIGVRTSKRVKHKKVVKGKPRRSRYDKKYIAGSQFTFQTWFLLPRAPFAVNILLDRRPNLQETMNYIKSKRPKRRFYNTFNLAEIHDLIPTASDYLLGITAADTKEATRLAFLNESVRRRIKTLVRHWKRSRFSRANEEDLITVERPVKEVIVYDWPARKSYHFEASTIMRCLTRRILSHDLLFIQPLEPVNPYTNLPFTLGNMHSIIDQLRTYGMTHWALEALRAAQYHWPTFKLMAEKPLQMDALKKTFLEGTDDACDLLYDFIESEHGIHGRGFNEDVYLWAIKNAEKSPHIMKWRQLCYTYYYSAILYKDIPIKAKVIYSNALKTAYSKGIFNLPKSIINMAQQSASPASDQDDL
jgi:hypothetical protein